RSSFDAVDDTEQIDTQLGTSRRFRLLLERPHPHQAGIVDENIDRTEIAADGVEEVGEGFGVGDVESVRMQAMLLGGLPRGGMIRIADGDLSACGGETAGDRLPDS